MRVGITGATGFLGRLVAHQLVSDGHAVRALVRSERPCDVAGVEAIAGDLGNAADIDRLVHGVDAVVHCGARVQTTGPWAEFQAINVDATARLLAAAAHHGVQRVVHVSSLSVYGIGRDGETITEDSPYEDGAAERGFYSRSKLAADRLAMEAAAQGAPVTVVRPGVLYGPGRRPPLGRRAFALGSLRLILGNPEYLLPLAYGENVADAIAAALQRPHAAGRAYTLVDPQVPMRDYVVRYRAASGARFRPVFVPAAPLLPVVGLVGIALRLLGRTSPVTTHQIQRATWSATFDCRRAQSELGWTSRVGLDEGLQRTFSAAPAAAVQSPSVPVTNSAST